MRQSWRDQFIADASRHGLTVQIARSLLSKARTLQRLAEAQCNGDWPADNGERAVKECPRCQGLWVPSTIKKQGCPDCRAQDSAVRLMDYWPGYTVSFQGDPRGCVLVVNTPDGHEIGVPS